MFPLESPAASACTKFYSADCTCVFLHMHVIFSFQYLIILSSHCSCIDKVLYGSDKFLPEKYKAVFKHILSVKEFCKFRGTCPFECMSKRLSHLKIRKELLLHVCSLSLIIQFLSVFSEVLKMLTSKNAIVKVAPDNIKITARGKKWPGERIHMLAKNEYSFLSFFWYNLIKKIYDYVNFYIRI